MSDIGGMVEKLIAAGTPPALAAQVVAEAFAAGASSGGFRGIPVDEVAERRRAYDRERKRKSTGIPPESTGIPNSPLSIVKEEKKERGRGTRLPPEFQLPSEGREFCKKRGWSDAQIDEEFAGFREHWLAKPGSGGLKLDWLLTWQKWVRGARIKPANDPVREPAGGVRGFYAKADSEQLDAWDAWSRDAKGKNMPRDKNGGWRVESEWPPGYNPPRNESVPFVPKLRAMQ